MQKCILKWLVSVSESVPERIHTFQLPGYHSCSVQQGEVALVHAWVVVM